MVWKARFNPQPSPNNQATQLIDTHSGARWSTNLRWTEQLYGTKRRQTIGSTQLKLTSDVTYATNARSGAAAPAAPTAAACTTRAPTAPAAAATAATATAAATAARRRERARQRPVFLLAWCQVILTRAPASEYQYQRTMPGLCARTEKIVRTLHGEARGTLDVTPPRIHTRHTNTQKRARTRTHTHPRARQHLTRAR